MKKQRTIWLSDREFNKLKKKAEVYFSGKGMIEKFLRKIIDERIIFIQGDGGIKITTE